METQIVYCDETGDDGLNTASSELKMTVREAGTFYL